MRQPDSEITPSPSTYPAGFCLANRYLLHEVLGRGATATIYKATDQHSGEPCAVKHLSLPHDLPLNEREMRIQRFHNEALTMQLLNHPHIMRVYAELEQDHEFYLIAELIDGFNLKILTQFERPPLTNVLNWMEQLLDALEYAQAHRIIHRDIKPENIMVTADLKIKLLDFGIAKIEGRQRLTFNGSLLGTIAYMSPEQLQDSHLITAQSDIYSLGVLAYELLTGQLPFNSADPGTAIRAIFESTPATPIQLNPATGPDLSHLVMTCLQKLPQHRFAHCSQLRQMLTTVKNHLLSEPHPTAPHKSRLPRIRHFENYNLRQAVEHLLLSRVSGEFMIWNIWQQAYIQLSEGLLTKIDIKNKHLGVDLLLMDVLAWESGNFWFIPGSQVDQAPLFHEEEQELLLKDADVFLRQVQEFSREYHETDIPLLRAEIEQLPSCLAPELPYWIDGQRCLGEVFNLMPCDRLSVLYSVQELESKGGLRMQYGTSYLR